MKVYRIEMETTLLVAHKDHPSMWFSEDEEVSRGHFDDFRLLTIAVIGLRQFGVLVIPPLLFRLCRRHLDILMKVNVTGSLYQIRLGEGFASSGLLGGQCLGWHFGGWCREVFGFGHHSHRRGVALALETSASLNHRGGSKSAREMKEYRALGYRTRTRREGERLLFVLGGLVVYE